MMQKSSRFRKRRTRNSFPDLHSSWTKSSNCHQDVPKQHMIERATHPKTTTLSFPVCIVHGRPPYSAGEKSPSLYSLTPSKRRKRPPFPSCTPLILSTLLRVVWAWPPPRIKHHALFAPLCPLIGEIRPRRRCWWPKTMLRREAGTNWEVLGKSTED